MDAVAERLLKSQEPAIRLKTREVLGESAGSAANIRLQQEIKGCQRVKLLLSERSNGIIPFHPYAKWFGSHWILATLADLRYPAGDRTLIPMRDQVYEWLFSEGHMKYVRRHEVYAGPYMKVKGLARAHASMEGNAVYYLNKLGLADDRTTKLADRLAEWQWPDGGWNCDKSPRAHTSSFTESLLPLRGLAAHKKAKGGYRDVIDSAADFFLQRRLFKRKRDGKVISPKFTKLHYPCYWHYDVLFALTVMKEGGFIKDERCSDALALLESKGLPDGGFPAEERYYNEGRRVLSRRSTVSWGGVSSTRMNEFVTCEALGVLTFK
jgi:hypothetical protein